MSHELFGLTDELSVLGVTRETVYENADRFGHLDGHHASDESGSRHGQEEEIVCKPKNVNERGKEKGERRAAKRSSETDTAQRETRT